MSLGPEFAGSLAVRVPNWIGDAVLSLAALRDMHRAFPRARLTVVARPWVAGFYEAVPEVAEIRAAPGFRDAVRAHAGCDGAVLFTNSFGTALQAWLARVPERWGYATDARGLLLTRRCAVRAEVRGRSQVHYYRELLRGLGVSLATEPDTVLHCPPAWSARGAELLGEGMPCVGINAGAAYGTAKRWLPERFAAAADLLAKEQGLRPVLLGGPAERSLAGQIAAMMTTPARVLCGQTTLQELIGVLSRLGLLLTNDSGPMHLAAALGVPVLAVFGPTDWRETAPVGPRARLVREPVDCSPCLLRECPIDHRCMRRVSVDRVVAEALELLRGHS